MTWHRNPNLPPDIIYHFALSFMKSDHIRFSGFFLAMKIGRDILCVTVTLNLGIAAYTLSMIYFLIMFYLSVMVDQICFICFVFVYKVRCLTVDNDLGLELGHGILVLAKNDFIVFNLYVKFDKIHFSSFETVPRHDFTCES